MDKEVERKKKVRKDRAEKNGRVEERKKGREAGKVREKEIMGDYDRKPYLDKREYPVELK